MDRAPGRRQACSLPAAAGLWSPEALAQGAAQDTAEAPDETQAPPPEGEPTDTPEPPPAETPEPPGRTGRTGEPAPSETPELPPETIEPTPGDPPEETGLPEATGEASPGPEDTAAPGATGPATAEATGTPPPTATDSTSEDGLLGTVRIGAEESGPPPEPVQVTLQEWLRLALALVVVLLVATIGGRLLYRLVLWALARRRLDVDESLLAEMRPLLSWWLAAIAFQIAVIWVDFENGPARELFADLVFLVYLGVATLTAWRLVDPAIDMYAKSLAGEGHAGGKAKHAKGQSEKAATIERLRPLIRRWVRALILAMSALVALGRLDVGFSVSALLVMAIGLTIALAARDTMTDIVAGFSILIDQPFRIGDRIEVQGVDTWAEVVNVGLRSSVLRTRHNAEIVVPNSIIGKGQVINYSYPDSRYRMETHVGVAFGTDVERARRVMIDAVRQVEFVLPDEPVEALYVEIGDSDMIFRVRWWIDFNRDWERSYDRVHTALHNALDRAGIESPYPGQSLNVQVDDQTLAEVWQAWQEEEA